MTSNWTRREILTALASPMVLGALPPRAVSRCAGSVAVVRIAVAAGILFPIGVFMGTAVSAGHEGGSREIALLNAVAVGNQWRHIGLCFGGGRDHLFGGRNIGVVLGRVGVLPSRVFGGDLDGTMDDKGFDDGNGGRMSSPPFLGSRS